MEFHSHNSSSSSTAVEHRMDQDDDSMSAQSEVSAVSSHHQQPQHLPNMFLPQHHIQGHTHHFQPHHSHHSSLPVQSVSAPGNHTFNGTISMNPAAVQGQSDQHISLPGSPPVHPIMTSQTQQAPTHTLTPTIHQVQNLNNVAVHQLQLTQHAQQQLTLMRYREQLGARLRGKKEALEFMIHRLAMNDEMWKVVDLEEYTLESPDLVITDRHIHDLACALVSNTQVVAIRLPECDGLVTWNALWPLFESLKHNKSVTRMFVSSSGKIFGHVVSVFLTNSILGFFDCNYTIRTLGSFSKAPALKKDIRVSLNRNILHHYVPKKVALLRKLWHSRLPSDHPLKGSGNDALSLLFEFDEHFQMVKNMAKGKGMKCPTTLGTDPCFPLLAAVQSSDSVDEDFDLDMENHGCACGEVMVVNSKSSLGKHVMEIQDTELDQDIQPLPKRSRIHC